MVHKQPGQCPVCGGDMIIKELECPTCQVTVSGSFETCPFCILTGEQLKLIKIFLKSRGNIKEVERRRSSGSLASPTPPSEAAWTTS